MAMEDMSAVATDLVDPSIVGDAAIPDDTETPEDLSAEVGSDVPAERADGVPTEPIEEYSSDGRKIPQPIRALFKDPAVGKDIRSMWGERAAFREDFPDGPKQAKELLAQIEEMGGREGLESLRGSRAELQQIDEMLSNGSTAILDRVQQQSPDAIGKLAPEFMTRWGQVDPEGCNRTLCGVIANTFASPVADTGANLGMNLMLAKTYMELNQPEKAIGVLEKIGQWSNQFGAIASAPPKQKPAAPPEIETRARSLDDREMKLFDAGLNRSIEESRQPIIERELKPFLSKSGELSATKREFLMDAILKRERATLEADKPFVAKYNAYRNAKDDKGAAAAMRNKLNAVLPGIVQLLAREVLGSPAKPRVAAPPINTPAPRQVPSTPVNPQDAKADYLNSVFAR